MNKINTVKKSDKLIPWYFVIFFLTIAIIDSVFIVMAISTHTGVVAEHAYEIGLNYNKVIARNKEKSIAP